MEEPWEDGGRRDDDGGGCCGKWRQQWQQVHELEGTVLAPGADHPCSHRGALSCLGTFFFV